MAKATTAAEPAVAGGELTLTEFCRRLSESERRVALIGGFEFSEKAKGRLKDTEASYKARFAEFINQPA